MTRQNDTSPNARNAATKQAVKNRGLASTALTLVASLFGVQAHEAAVAQEPALPTGGGVVSGKATIGDSNNGKLTITQGSDRAVVNWNSFNIGAGNQVNFLQPGANAAILNRVTGNTGTNIAGQLTANGSVFLINPNGIQITSSGAINAGRGFVASTLDMSDSDFMKGAGVFSGTGGLITHEGAITVGAGGQVGLLGGAVRSTGVISAPTGKVVIGAGTRATLDLNGGGFLQVTLPESAVVPPDGGTAIVGIDAASHAMRNSINLAGEAISVYGENGNVVLGGRIDAAGGSVTVTGQNIALRAAQIDVSAAGGGGTVKIGGGWQGQGDLVRAENLLVDAASTIKADAIGAGDGGTAVLWSDNRTDFTGAISARGGADSGDGGNAEVSGKAVLAYDGVTDLSAPNGRFGTLLLDPYNLTISSAADTGVNGFSANANDSILNVTTLTNALALANVTVSTGTGGTQAGDITVANAVSWSAPTTLTLNAYRNILVNANIANSAANAGLVLRSDSTGTGIGTVTFGSGVTAALSGGGSTANLYYNPTSYTSPTSFSQVTASDRRIWMLVNTVDNLQAMSTRLGGQFALGRNIDASATASWNGGAGFAPIGTNASSPFVGRFDGQGFVVSGLTINRPSTDNVGLFGYVGGAEIRNVGVSGGSITGYTSVGGLVGFATESAGVGPVIRNSWSSATVSGYQNIGGLVGDAAIFTLIENSYAKGNVSAPGGNSGGLVGRMDGSIVRGSYATGSVTADGLIGGLVGVMENSDPFYMTAVSNSYATGQVSGGTTQGGLVGYAAPGTSISNSYWDSYSTGRPFGIGISAGAVTNLNAVTSDPAETIAARIAFNQAAYANFNFTTDWVMMDGNSRPFGRWEIPTNGVINNAHQLQLMNQNLNGNYVLAGNIDASETGRTAFALTSDRFNGMWAGRGFVPVGSGFSGPSRFGGSFDGQGHTISGLAINRIDEDLVALFGSASGGTIRNVGLSGGSISGRQNVGGLVGLGSSITVSNSWSSASIIGSRSWIGGLIGSTGGGSISDSYATGSVTATGNNHSFIGGLIGSYGGGSIERSFAGGNVTSSAVSTHMGGLVGQLSGGSVSNSYANGNVSTPGGSFVGGLSGSVFSSAISNSHATGSVIGGGAVGGLAGLTNGSTVFDSYATGSVTPNTAGLRIGGLIGDADTGSRIERSFATGAVNAATSTAVGGLIGRLNRATVADSYATGDVTGDAQVGGLVGLIQSTTSASAVSRTYATGRVTGGSQTGGLVGRISAGLALNGAFNSYWDTFSTGQTAAVGQADSGTVVFVDPVTSDPTQSGAANYAFNPSAWANFDLTTIDTTGGQARTWRMYEGFTRPLLKSFMTAATVDTGNGASVVYNGATQSSSGGFTLRNGLSTAPVFGTLSASGRNAGTYAISMNGLYSNQLGYDLISGTQGTFTITPKALTITGMTAGNKVYDGNTVAALSGGALQGLISGDIVTFSGQTGAFANQNAGNGKAVTVTNTTLAGADAANYTVSNPTGLTANITPKGLTIIGMTAGNKVYDATTAATLSGGTLQGLVGSETLTFSGASGAFGDQNVGVGKAVTVSGLTLGDGTNGGLASNYTLTAPTSLTADITRKMVTVTADNARYTYNGLAFGEDDVELSFSGLLDGFEVLDYTNYLVTGSAMGARNVGTYTFTPGGLSAQNYDFTYVGATLIIDQKALTISGLLANNKIYDGTTAATFSGGVLNGLVGSETLTFSSVGAFANRNVGNGTAVSLTSLTLGNGANGGLAGNYTLTLPSGPFAANITPRALTITGMTAANKVYDGNTVAALSGGALQGLVAGETLSFSGQTGAFADKNAGNGKVVTVSGVTLSDGTGLASNYTISNPTGLTANITPAALSVTALNASRTYDATAFSGGAGVTIVGLVGGDTVASLGGALGYGGSAQGAINAGAYTITPNGLTSNNYAITFINGALTITPRALSVVYTANPAAFIYGNTPSGLTGTVTPTGLVGGDTLTGAAVWTTTATSATGVGNYAIVGSGLTASSNYTLTASQAAGNATALRINPRALSVVYTANPAALIYGNAPTGLTGTVSSTGLVNGDTLSGTAVWNTIATAASNVGAYGITGSGLTASANYTLTATQAAGNATALRIDPRTVVVIANPQSRMFGLANPGLTFTIGAGGLLGSDTLTGALATIANATSPIGLYAITQGTLAAPSNYVIAYTGAQLEVTPAPSGATSRFVGNHNGFGDEGDGGGQTGAGNGAIMDDIVPGKDINPPPLERNYTGQATPSR